MLGGCIVVGWVEILGVVVGWSRNVGQVDVKWVLGK